MSSGDLVLVTGGSGFVASYCILQLLEKGYHVRTTIRDVKRADNVRRVLQNGGATEEAVNSIQFFAAELGKDDGWQEACTGCTYVLHVASPFPLKNPKHEDELIIPATEGTLRALRAAKAAGTVKRVVVTSSFAAIGYGHPDQKEPFTEKDWTDLNGHVPPYPKSKTVAERAAWDWIEEMDSKSESHPELAVVNPVAVFGPLLDKSYAASCEIVVRLMNGALPGLPDMYFGITDVRDVAALHLLAMTEPQAAGQRYLATSPGDAMSMYDVAMILKKRMGDKARKVPTRRLPDWLLRIAALFDSTIGLIIPELGRIKNATSEKAQTELSWKPRSAEDAIVATAESMDKHGLLK